MLVGIPRDLAVGDLLEVQDARIESHRAIQVADRHADGVDGGDLRFGAARAGGNEPQECREQQTATGAPRRHAWRTTCSSGAAVRGRSRWSANCRATRWPTRSAQA